MLTWQGSRCTLMHRRAPPSLKKNQAALIQFPSLHYHNSQLSTSSLQERNKLIGSKVMASAMRQFLYSAHCTSHVQLSSPLPLPYTLVTTGGGGAYKKRFSVLAEFYGRRNMTAVAKSSPENDGIVAADDDGEDGVSLGTLKLPLNTDLQRFETLLFQWANSLCQGANLPLPVPLKVDKIAGGVRLGFITIGDGKTEVLVYIDCLVFPPADGSGPIFRAIRNGKLKDTSPPGEPRIMRSLLQALQNKEIFVNEIEYDIPIKFPVAQVMGASRRRG